MLILLRALLILGVLALWIYGIVDVIATRKRRPQALPKWAWLPIVVLVPVLGSLAWLLLGRPEGGGLRPGGSPDRARAPRAPEDSPEFLDRLNHEIRRQRLRDELRRIKRDGEEVPPRDDPKDRRGETPPDDPDRP
jgi:hypothetical protein